MPQVGERKVLGGSRQQSAGWPAAALLKRLPPPKWPNKTPQSYIKQTQKFFPAVPVAAIAPNMARTAAFFVVALLGVAALAGECPTRD